MDTSILSDRINRLSPSATLTMAAKAREMRTEGIDIISLSIGEPDFNTPDFVKEAGIKAINENYTKYTPVDGYVDFKKAICEKFKRDNNLDYKPSQIVVSNGAKQSIYNVAQVLLNDGDEAIIPAPYWVSYVDIVKLAGGVPVIIPTTIHSDFKITPEQLEAAITPKTKMVWFNSPNNPSGSVYSREEYEKLVEVLEKHPKIIVLSDEIYDYINFTDKHCSIASVGSMIERTITINGVSKSHSMTGWRIGYMAAPEVIAKACTKLQGQITSGAGSISQMASIEAVKSDKSKVQYMVDSFKRRRDLVLDLLKEIPGFIINEPQGAFYVFPNVTYYYGKTIKGRKIENSLDFSLLLLEEAHVACVTGDAFGNSNCVRISYAASEETLKEAFRRIKAVLSETLVEA